MIAEQGTCTVTCEFCQKPYKFDAIDVEQLFRRSCEARNRRSTESTTEDGFRKRYVAFLNELSKLAKTHDELTDTDVRERLHEVINYHFIWGKPMKGFAKRFAMMSAAADRKVAAVVKKFVVDARRIAENAAVKAGASRHALIEDEGRSRIAAMPAISIWALPRRCEKQQASAGTRGLHRRKSKKKCMAGARLCRRKAHGDGRGCHGDSQTRSGMEWFGRV